MTALSASQLAALAEMQIPVWQRRASVPAHASEAVPDVQIEPGKAFIFVVQQALTASEQKLFNSITQALNCHEIHYQLIETVISVQKLSQYREIEWLILFGIGDKPTADIGLNQLHCPALSDMLIDPDLKAQAWQQLRALRRVSA